MLSEKLKCRYLFISRERKKERGPIFDWNKPDEFYVYMFVGERKLCLLLGSGAILYSSVLFEFSTSIDLVCNLKWVKIFRFNISEWGEMCFLD